MEKVIIKNTRIELKQGNIANQPDMEAVVNAANAQLKIGGGVAGAIHRGAGPGLESETAPLAPIKPGEAVITGAHNLPNKYIIHCLGPVYGRDKPEAEILGNCYRNTLKLAEENDIERIAFPAISCGAFGYPVQEAARVALLTVKSIAEELSRVRLICFVLFSDDAMEAHQEILDELNQTFKNHHS